MMMTKMMTINIITGRALRPAGYFCIYNYQKCLRFVAVKNRTFRIMSFVSTQKVA